MNKAVVMLFYWCRNILWRSIKIHYAIHYTKNYFLKKGKYEPDSNSFPEGYEKMIAFLQFNIMNTATMICTFNLLTENLFACVVVRE